LREEAWEHQGDGFAGEGKTWKSRKLAAKRGRDVEMRDSRESGHRRADTGKEKRQRARTGLVLRSPQLGFMEKLTIYYSDTLLYLASPARVSEPKLWIRNFHPCN